MDFIVKKTTEFSSSELIEMNNLFNEVFDKDRSFNDMINLYTMNPLGYSYHSVFLENGHIVGMNVYVPYYYRIEGKKVLFANSIDSMIQKRHRDFFNFMDLVNSGYEYMKKEGVVLVYGYPNDNAYPILIKAKLMKEIGRMSTYCLPFRIGGIKKGLKCLNWVSILLCWIWVGFSSLFKIDSKCSYKIEKDIESFNKTRYSLRTGNYKVEDGFTYKVMEYEDIRVAFLIDVYEKSSKNFCKAIKYIMKHEINNFDIILYPGNLSILNTGMIKIPHKYEPKRFSLCIKILDPTYSSDLLLNFNEWDNNLSNFDLI